MTKIIFTSIILMLYLSWSKVFAFIGTRVIAISPTKYSIALDHGLFKSRVLGEKFKFYKSYNTIINEDKGNKTRYLKSLGVGEIVQISEDRAYLFFKNKIKLEIKTGEVLYYSPDYMIGRSPLIVNHSIVALDSNQKSLEVIPTTFKKKFNKDYSKEKINFKNNHPYSEDVRVTKFVKYKKWPFKNIIGSTAIEVLRPEDIDGKFSDGSIRKKIAQDLYLAEQKSIIASKDVEKYKLYEVFSKYNEQPIKADDQSVDLNTRKIIKNKGLRLTRNMSDDKIRDYFVISGIKHELDNQKRSMERNNGNEIHLTYFNGLVANTTGVDVLNQGLNYGLGLSFEYHLVKIVNILSRFTIKADLTQEVSNYDLGGINGHFSEGNFSIYLNWYYRLAPTEIKKFIPYLSLGYKRGSAVASASSLTQKYRYQIVGLPSFLLGIKYRFSAGDYRNTYYKLGLGINLFLESTQKHLIVAETLNDNIFGTLAFNDVKLGMGVSFYF